MSKSKEIINKIKELNGGEYQSLMDIYLTKKGYENINQTGSKTGTNKTIKGTPDTYFKKGDKYIFAEYTTQEKNLLKKIKEDIKKCFDETKTGIPISKISEIIIGYTGDLKVYEEEELRGICKKHDIKVTLISVTTLAYDIYNEYPIIAKDELGIPIDTGQICSLEEFIEQYDKNELVTKLDTVFVSRDLEIEKILDFFKKDDLVILSGKPGVGKSRLALEVCNKYVKEFKGEKKIDSYAVFDKGKNIFDDMKKYFSGNETMKLIFIDDVNRISHFKYFVDLLKTGKNRIKIIATVRDYAKMIY